MPSWFARVFAVSLALAAFAWGAVMLPLLWQGRSIEATAQQILQGDRFVTSELAAAVAKADQEGPSWSAATRRSVAVLRLRLVEDALTQGDRLSLDQRLTDLKHSIVDLFAIDPADSFFWFIYYWCTLTTEGFSPSQLKYLDLSYQLGHNEGWIAAKRNRFALAVVSQLSPEMSAKVFDEFAGLVSSGFFADAARSLLGPGAVVGKQLLQRIASLPIADRERFAGYLRDTGADIAVPGVAVPEKHFY